MKNEDLPFAFTLAFVLHLVVIAIYDLNKDLQPEVLNPPRMIKIKLGSSSAEESPPQTQPSEEIKIQQIIEEEIGSEILQEQPQKKNLEISVSQKPTAKLQGSEYGNSNDADAISAPSYLDLLQVTVQERSAIPHLARAQQQYGSAVLRLSFNRNGYVKKFRLVKPTGYEILDQEALRVARSLTRNPFPPAPKSFDRGQRILTYDFPISFDPR